MPVEILIRDSSFVCSFEKDASQFLIPRSGDALPHRLPASWSPSTDEFIVDRVEVKAIFGVSLFATAEGHRKYLVVCRDADLVADFGANNRRIWKVKRCEFIDFGSTSFSGNESLKCFLNSGCFYFQTGQSDITLVEAGSSFDWAWALRENLAGSVPCAVLLQGYVGQRRLFAEDGEPWLLTLLGRRSRERCGQRFNARGVDEQGNVANFVETELSLCREFAEDSYSVPWSFVQIRGSVPLSWTQSAGSLPELLKRSNFQGRNLQLHHMRLLRRYHNIAYVDLLCRTKEGEKTLSVELAKQVNKIAKGHYFHFDFNTEIATGSSLRKSLEPLISSLTSFQADNKVIIRTNCLDCLDRTNAVQMLIAFEAFKSFWKGEDVIPDEFVSLWVENGDELSKIYTGSGSVLSRYLRSAGSDKVGSFFEQTWRSAERLYSHHFEADERESAIADLLRKSQVSQLENFKIGGMRGEALDIDVLAVTWNVGGSKSFESELDQVLLVGSDVVVVGIQEVVALDISAFLFQGKRRSEERAEHLEAALTKSLELKYVVVETEVMVGLCIVVLIRKELKNQVGRIWSKSVKTGIGGAAGNKGAVMIGFELGLTSFAFVNVHLDSGELKHAERASQLATIMSQIPSNSPDRKSVILGDFNFRMGAGKLVPSAVIDEIQKDEDISALLKYDEYLSGLIDLKETNFRTDYAESDIEFKPTYKVEVQSKEDIRYNLERCPGWCDRIFVKGGHFRVYESVTTVTSSDHKAVRAFLLFNADLLATGLYASEANGGRVASVVPEEDWVLVASQSPPNYLD